MANFVSGLAQTAVRAAPFAAKVLADKQARDAAQRKELLAQLHQQSVDNTAQVDAMIRAGLGVANIGKLNAETLKLREPTPEKRTYDPVRGVMVNETQGTAAPVAGLPDRPVPPKAPGNIDPLSPQGIDAAAARAGKVAAAEAPFKKDPNAPPAAKPTESQEKSYLFYNLMEKAQPQINAAMTSGKVRKAAVSAYLMAPEIAQPALNSQLTSEEQSLIRAFRDFAAGVLRKESGAAVTPGELREVWGRYGPGFGDDPALDKQKSDARQQYMDSMRDIAAPALEYYNKHRAAPADAGNIDLRTSSGGADAEAAWAAKNPPKPGESFESYHARYLNATQPDASSGRSVPDGRP
jgi:hypothetical protein